MQYAKIIGAGAVALIIYLGYLYVSNLQDDLVTSQKNEAKLQTANETLVKERDNFKQDLAESKENIMEINKKYIELEERHGKVIRIFSDHDFTKLYQAKPNLIIKKMNKATDKIFKEIENASKK